MTIAEVSFLMKNFWLSCGKSETTLRNRGEDKKCLNEHFEKGGRSAVQNESKINERRMNVLIREELATTIEEDSLHSCSLNDWPYCAKSNNNEPCRAIV